MKYLILVLLLFPQLAFAGTFAPPPAYLIAVRAIPPEAPTVVDLTADRRLQLETVNSAVNAAIRYRDDGRGWLSKTACAAYAIEKMRRLVALGWPRGALHLAIAVMPQSPYIHAVLMVDTPGKTIVLGNIKPYPYAKDSADHISYWMAREEQGGWRDLRR